MFRERTWPNPGPAGSEFRERRGLNLCSAGSEFGERTGPNPSLAGSKFRERTVRNLGLAVVEFPERTGPNPGLAGFGSWRKAGSLLRTPNSSRFEVQRKDWAKP